MQLLRDEFLTYIQRLSKDPLHAVILEGVAGRGARYEAEVFSGMLGGLTRIVEKPADKQLITIEQIQKLYTETRSKNTVRNTWLIVGAEDMSEEAQNAFLKLLEEPPAKVTFILSVSNAEKLLPTIRSRSVKLRCQPFSLPAAKDWLKFQGIQDSSHLQQLIFLAEGSADELVRLVSDAGYGEAKLQVAKDAKLLISGTVFEKISFAGQTATDRQRALDATRIVLQMLSILLAKQPDRTQFMSQIGAFSRAHERLQQNGNIRLQLLRASL